MYIDCLLNIYFSKNEQQQNPEAVLKALKTYDYSIKRHNADVKYLGTKTEYEDDLDDQGSEGSRDSEEKLDAEENGQEPPKIPPKGKPALPVKVKLQCMYVS